MDKHAEFERQYWGTCVNTYDEETKQIIYAMRMGFTLDRQHPEIWVPDMRILDLGGGPVSLLLKAKGFKEATVVDPGEYPQWVMDRYRQHHVQYMKQRAEDYRGDGVGYDECWIYNTLQHVQDPGRVVITARRLAEKVRIFEWVEEPESLGHPHELHIAELNQWLGGRGRVEHLNEFGCTGLAYYGIFNGC